MTWEQLLSEIVSKGPFVVSLLVILWAGHKRIWVYGYQLEEMKQDRDDWKNLAMNGTNLADKAVDKIDKIRRVR